MARPKSPLLPIDQTFKYDEFSPSCVVRLTGDHKGGTGNLRPDGYYRFQYNNKSWLAHHIVWVLHGRELPDGKLFVIDHIDQDKSNNRIENLRIASKSGNSINRTGYKNVSYCKRDKKWRGYFKLNGKQYSKYFNTEEEARAYAVELKQKLGGEYVPESVF